MGLQRDTTEQQQFMSDAWKCLTILVEFIYNLHEMTSEKIVGFLNHQSIWLLWNRFHYLITVGILG